MADMQNKSTHDTRSPTFQNSAGQEMEFLVVSQLNT
jgi:hypothetical protein